MKFGEFVPSQAVYTEPPEVKERREYSIDAVWKYKRESALRLAKDLFSGQINGLVNAQEMHPYLEMSEGSHRVAQVLMRENRRRIAAGDSALEADSEEAKAFVHYIMQTLKKGVFATPRWDDWEQTFYPSNGGHSDIMPGVDIPRALMGLATNHDEVETLFVGKEGERQQEISEILEQGNLVIVSNHCTWLNLPMIVASLHLELGIPLDKINTILGPALTTYEQGLGVAGISNLIKTIPETPNGRLDEVAPGLQRKVRMNSLRKINELMKETGQVLIMSPGGTTDRVTKEAIELLEASKVTQKLVKGLAKTNHVWPIATHTGALYADHKIRAGKFRFFEDGILEPNQGENAIRKLKHNMRTLNPERNVTVMPENKYTGRA